MFSHYGKTIKVRAREIAINTPENEDEIERILSWLKEQVKEAWENRDKITPKYKERRSSPPRWQKAGSGRNTALSLQKKVGGRLSNTWRDLILIDGSGQRAQKFSGRYNPYAAVIHIFLAFEVYLIKVRYI